jgi:HlyD family secretion protein
LPGAASAVELSAPVKRGTLVEAIPLTGNAVALRSTQVTFQSSGTIATVAVHSGQVVPLGETMAELAVGTGPAGTASVPTVPLTAPFGGLVTSVEVMPGQLVTPQTVVARLIDPTQYYVAASVSEYDVLRLQLYQPVDVVFPAVSNDTLSGRLIDVAQTGTVQGERVSFPVRIGLDDAIPERLRPGMTARASVTLRRLENVLYVPARAIRRGDAGAFVSRVEPEGRIVDVPVEVGDAIGGDVEVRGGLKEGDTVAVHTSAPPS